MSKEYIQRNSKQAVDSTCWLWKLSLYRDGYGQAQYEGVKLAAHRLSYLSFVGEVPKGLLVLHTCNVKHCVNPQHLYIGTAKQNSKDAARDGLMGPKNPARGTHNGRCVLTEDLVIYIRSKETSHRTSRSLAFELKVSPSLIKRVRRNEIWKHV